MESYDNLHKSPIENRLAAALHGVVQIWDRRMHVSDNSIVGKLARESGRVAQVLGIDIDAIQGEALKALPMPKAWGNLTDNGQHGLDGRTDVDLQHETIPPSTKVNGQVKTKRHSSRARKGMVRNPRLTAKPRGPVPRKRQRG